MFESEFVHSVFCALLDVCVELIIGAVMEELGAASEPRQIFWTTQDRLA